MWVAIYLTKGNSFIHSKTVTQITQSVSESLDDDSPESLFSLSPESLESLELLPLPDDESPEPDPCNENTNEIALSPCLVCIYCTECGIMGTMCQSGHMFPLQK